MSTYTAGYFAMLTGGFWTDVEPGTCNYPDAANVLAGISYGDPSDLSTGTLEISSDVQIVASDDTVTIVATVEA